MSRTSMVRRAAGISLAAGTVGVLVALAPTAANAAVLSNGPQTLAPGSSMCVGLHADSDAKGTGTADNPGVVYIMTRNGAEIYRTATRRTGAFTSPVFVGAGFYQWCAKNAAGLSQAVTNVSVSVLTDGDA